LIIIPRRKHIPRVLSMVGLAVKIVMEASVLSITIKTIKKKTKNQSRKAVTILEEASVIMTH
jgi:hypothetical protein